MHANNGDEDDSKNNNKNDNNDINDIHANNDNIKKDNDYSKDKIKTACEREKWLNLGIVHGR